MPLPPSNAKTAQKHTQGGFQSACFYSGAVAPGLVCAPNAVAVGADVLLCSGPGRLDSIQVNPPFFSGLLLSVVLYDAATPVSGGPLYSSGHKILAWTPQMISNVSGLAPVSGVNNPGSSDLLAAVPRFFAIPFQSGLCLNSRSGQPSVTISWTPEAPSF